MRTGAVAAGTNAVAELSALREVFSDAHIPNNARQTRNDAP